MILAILATLMSCFSLASRDTMDAGYADYSAEESYDADLPGSAPAVRSEEPMGLGAVATEPIDLVRDGSQEPQTEEPAAERLRVFSADLELVVASVEQSRNNIIVTVESLGGYIESSTADFVVLRVPAESFDSAVETIESEGDVRSRRIRTADVTDQFFDLERRLLISQTSRDRLLELLEQAEDADERVRILRDIRRLTEEIEQLRSALESLAQQISYSRISVRLISRIQVSSIGRLQIPFPWIRNLSPVGTTLGPAREGIDLEPGEEFAVFNTGQSLFAEAADGTQFRAGATPNDPGGDEGFWQRALAHHLAPLYREAQELSAGDYRGVLLRSRDVRPFTYVVLTRVRGDELIVVEIFLPDPDAAERRLDSILTKISGGAS